VEASLQPACFKCCRGVPGVRYVVIHITLVPLGVTVAFPRQKGPTIRAISALGVSGTELGEWADVASE